MIVGVGKHKYAGLNVDQRIEDGTLEARLMDSLIMSVPEGVLIKAQEVDIREGVVYVLSLVTPIEVIHTDLPCEKYMLLVRRKYVLSLV